MVEIITFENYTLSVSNQDLLQKKFYNTNCHCNVGWAKADKHNSECMLSDKFFSILEIELVFEGSVCYFENKFNCSQTFYMLNLLNDHFPGDNHEGTMKQFFEQTIDNYWKKFQPFKQAKITLKKIEG